MGDQKRSAPTFAAMEASSGAALSKKRKTSETRVSPATSVNSAGKVASGELFSGRLSHSCYSSSNVETSDVVEDSKAPLDLEANVFEIADSSTYSNVKLFRYLLSDFSGDSEETTVFPAKSSTAASDNWKIPAMKMAPNEEIEEFFAMAEKYEQKRFAEKYNYDIVKDMPLQGRYQWVRLI